MASQLVYLKRGQDLVTREHLLQLCKGCNLLFDMQCIVHVLCTSVQLVSNIQHVIGISCCYTEGRPPKLRPSQPSRSPLVSAHLIKATYTWCPVPESGVCSNIVKVIVSP